MQKIIFKLITPEKVVHEEEVEQVSIPTLDGEITILPDHTPLVSILGRGDIIALKNGEHIPFIALDGFVHVKDNEVAVLADFAEHVETIATHEAIDAAQKRAGVLQKKMENEEDVNFEHFESELERSLTTIRIGEKWRMRKYRK
jgi:F-type H+-transporting ATPase subunit epsilon